MRIDHLHVQNFRCFVEADFDFSPRFNLLVGINGSGKTSLLKAIVSAITTPFNWTQRGVVWPHAEEASARLALIEMQGKIRFDRCYPVRLEADGEVCGQPRSWWVAKDGPTSQPSWEHTIFSVISNEAAKIAQSGIGALPIAAFYSSERQWRLTGTSPEKAATTQESRFDAYKSWSDAAQDMKGLETWIIAKSLERLEEVANGQVGQDSRDDELSLVNLAIAQALEGAKGLRYDIKHRRLVLDWQIGDPAPFEALSDGQKAMCTLVADIARRMCLLNPQLGSNVLKETPGIVLIDELDMHLHPAWQRRIAQVLKGAFPKVQFFAASHSPQIIGELPAHEILLLRDGKMQGHPERAFGLDSSKVLEEVMGAPAQDAQVAAQLAEIRQALDDERLGDARCHLDKLKNGEGTALLVRLYAEIPGLDSRMPYRAHPASIQAFQQGKHRLPEHACLLSCRQWQSLM
ncbi:MAG: AAA family ATPase [Sulfuricellaceae bacterium]